VRHEIATVQLLHLAMTATLSLRASVAKQSRSVRSHVRHEIATPALLPARDDGSDTRGSH
jgi:hypothetical protein